MMKLSKGQRHCVRHLNVWSYSLGPINPVEHDACTNWTSSSLVRPSSRWLRRVVEVLQVSFDGRYRHETATIASSGI